MAILGADIRGLAVAYYLLQRGVQPVLFDAGTRHLDDRPEAIQPGDTELLDFLQDLNCGHYLIWKDAQFGAIVDGKRNHLYAQPGSVTSSAFFFPNRLRIAIGCWMLPQRDSAELRNTPVEPYLRSYFGSRIFETLWRPLLQAEFGDLYSRIPADWFCSRLRAGWFGTSASRGHIRGGAEQLRYALLSAVTLAGGTVRRQPLHWMAQEPLGVCLNVDGKLERFDAAVSTLALSELRDVSAGPLFEHVPLPQLVYQGHVGVTIVTQQRLQNYYWTAIQDARLPFHTLTESANQLHLGRYCRPGSEFYMKEDCDILSKALDGLSAVFPQFNRAEVGSARVVRDEYAAPVWPLGTAPLALPSQVGSSRVFLCTSAQAYPHAPSWNSAIAQARRMADELTQSLAGASQRVEAAAI